MHPVKEQMTRRIQRRKRRSRSYAIVAKTQTSGRDDKSVFTAGESADAPPTTGRHHGRGSDVNIAETIPYARRTPNDDRKDRRRCGDDERSC